LKVKLAVKRPYGDITVEGESFNEIVEKLKSLPQWIDVIDGLVQRTGTPKSKKDALRGVVEYTSDGPVITLPKERLSDKEAITLLLYANEPNTLQPKEIARLLTISGRLSAGFGARLSELRNEGLILKDAGGYRLTATGRSLVEETASKLRS
jgi:predicted transcriptional regulator